MGQQQQQLRLVSNFSVAIFLFCAFYSCAGNVKSVDFIYIFSEIEYSKKIVKDTFNTRILSLYENYLDKVPHWSIFCNKNERVIDSSIFNDFSNDVQVSIDWKFNTDFSNDLILCYPDVFEKIVKEVDYIGFSSELSGFDFLIFRREKGSVSSYLKDLKKEFVDSAFSNFSYKRVGKIIKYSAFNTSKNLKHPYFLGCILFNQNIVYDFQFRVSKIDTFKLNLFDIIINNAFNKNSSFLQQR